MDNLIQKLIQAVKERPFLYDFSDSDYKNHLKKTAAWNDIADEIGGEDGEIMKIKWKNLRDTYKKHKKSLHTSSGQVAKLKNWVWAAQMQFLDEFIGTRTPESALNSNTETNSQSNSDTHPNNMYLPSTSTSAQPPTSPSQSTEGSTRQQDIGRRKRRKDKSDDIDYPGTNDPKKEQNDRLDKIDYLFLNYADTFKSLSPKRQALLKLELAKLFTEAELAHLDDAET